MNTDTMSMLAECLYEVEALNHAQIARVVYAVSQGWDLVQTINDIEALKQAEHYLGWLEGIFGNEEIAAAQQTINEAVRRLYDRQYGS